MRGLDRCVPRRWQLPYTHAKLRLQGGLEEELFLLPRLLEGRRGVAIDVGANVGLYSYRLAKLSARVEAFEPNGDCLAVLDAYDAENIGTHRVALSSREGTCALHIPVIEGVLHHGLGTVGSTNARQTRTLEVRTRTLDSYGFDDVSFIKIDVEGHEMDVLAGSDRTIAQSRPNLLVEIEHRFHPEGMHRVIESILERDYEGFFIFENCMRPIADFQMEFHQQGYLDKRQSAKYVNNFFFRATG